MNQLTVSVIVCTFRRPNDLHRCLLALASQTRPADEIVVVVRDIDQDTWAFLHEHASTLPALRIQIVSVPGVVEALNSALSITHNDIFAIIDDDAAAHKDWIERLLHHFSDRKDVAGVGGKDWMHINNQLQEGRRSTVGRVPRYHGHTGNHHLGFGNSREVDVLKGVNASYRTELIRPIGFDRRLRGTGAQAHWEMSLGLALKSRGWKLLYDPNVAVDHFLAPRFDEDQRIGFNSSAQENMAFNEALIRLEYLPRVERSLFMFWALFVGSRALPGLVQALRLLPEYGATSVLRFFACARGRTEAWRALHAAER